jgi:hypothetical protein
MPNSPKIRVGVYPPRIQSEELPRLACRQRADNRAILNRPVAARTKGDYRCAGLAGPSATVNEKDGIIRRYKAQGSTLEPESP